MRLIDADEFQKFIQSLTDAGAPYEGVTDLLDKQPTAYDVDKVVEQLEKEFRKYYGENWKKAPYLVNAIEFVRSGGKE